MKTMIVPVLTLAMTFLACVMSYSACDEAHYARLNAADPPRINPDYVAGRFSDIESKLDDIESKLDKVSRYWTIGDIHDQIGNLELECKKDTYHDDVWACKAR